MKLILRENNYANLRKTLYSKTPSIKQIIKNTPKNDDLAYKYVLSHLSKQGIDEEKFAQLINKQREIINAEPSKTMDMSGIGTEVAYLDFSGALTYSLDISNNNLQDFPLEHLPPSLQLIYLFGNNFPDSFLEKLQRVYPNISIMEKDLPF